MIFGTSYHAFLQVSDGRWHYILYFRKERSMVEADDIQIPICIQISIMKSINLPSFCRLQ